LSWGDAGTAAAAAQKATAAHQQAKVRADKAIRRSESSPALAVGPDPREGPPKD
jgi:hypothetical protein